MIAKVGVLLILGVLLWLWRDVRSYNWLSYDRSLSRRIPTTPNRPNPESVLTWDLTVWTYNQACRRYPGEEAKS